ncbi:MAG: VCBS repeat-containing protein [Planctomycetes bacterium]|nr:VCBS repeat-containing protein [Planctomycetota bacterium]
MPYAPGRLPHSVALGDVDGGRLDIVTANGGNGDVSVLLGRAGGGFEAEVRYAAGAYPRSVALGDLDGDGRLDIVTANLVGDDVSVLPNVGGAAGPSIRLVVERPLYTTGERKVTRVDLLGQGEPADLYLLVDWPDGRQRHAFYLDGTWAPPGKLLAFSEEKVPVLRGARLEGQTGLVLNDYTFTGGEEEGTYTWTLSAEDSASGQVLAASSVQYQFRLGGGQELAVDIVRPPAQTLLRRGGDLLVEVRVSAAPGSTIRTVSASLSRPGEIGSLALGALRDDGGLGDRQPGDGLFTLSATVPPWPETSAVLRVKAEAVLAGGIPALGAGSVALGLTGTGTQAPQRAHVEVSLDTWPTPGEEIILIRRLEVRARASFPDGTPAPLAKASAEVRRPDGQGTRTLQLREREGDSLTANFEPSEAGAHRVTVHAVPSEESGLEPAYAWLEVFVWRGELHLVSLGPEGTFGVLQDVTLRADMGYVGSFPETGSIWAEVTGPEGPRTKLPLEYDLDADSFAALFRPPVAGVYQVVYRAESDGFIPAESRASFEASGAVSELLGHVEAFRDGVRTQLQKITSDGRLAAREGDELIADAEVAQVNVIVNLLSSWASAIGEVLPVLSRESLRFATNWHFPASASELGRSIWKGIPSSKEVLYDLSVFGATYVYGELTVNSAEKVLQSVNERGLEGTYERLVFPGISRLEGLLEAAFEEKLAALPVVSSETLTQYRLLLSRRAAANSVLTLPMIFKSNALEESIASFRNRSVLRSLISTIASGFSLGLGLFLGPLPAVAVGAVASLVDIALDYRELSEAYQLYGDALAVAHGAYGHAQRIYGNAHDALLQLDGRRPGVRSARIESVDARDVGYYFCPWYRRTLFGCVASVPHIRSSRLEVGVRNTGDGVASLLAVLRYGGERQHINVQNEQEGRPIAAIQLLPGEAGTLILGFEPDPRRGDAWNARPAEGTVLDLHILGVFDDGIEELESRSVPFRPIFEGIGGGGASTESEGGGAGGGEVETGGTPYAYPVRLDAMPSPDDTGWHLAIEARNFDQLPRPVTLRLPVPRDLQVFDAPGSILEAGLLRWEACLPAGGEVSFECRVLPIVPIGESLPCQGPVLSFLEPDGSLTDFQADPYVLRSRFPVRAVPGAFELQCDVPVARVPVEWRNLSTGAVIDVEATVSVEDLGGEVLLEVQRALRLAPGVRQEEAYDLRHDLRPGAYFLQIGYRLQGGEEQSLRRLFTVATNVPGPASSPSPPDGSPGISRISRLAWEAGPCSQEEDLYLWKENESRPVSPTVSALRRPEHMMDTLLDEAAAYLWQVVSRSAAGETAGPVWRFHTRGLESRFQRGDATLDGVTDISDPVRILSYLFLGSAEVLCEDAADANDDGIVDISDPIGILGFLFLGSAPPAPPFGACGRDGSADDLTCELYPPCGA